MFIKIVQYFSEKQSPPTTHKSCCTCINTNMMTNMTINLLKFTPYMWSDKPTLHFTLSLLMYNNVSRLINLKIPHAFCVDDTSDRHWQRSSKICAKLNDPLF